MKDIALKQLGSSVGSQAMEEAYTACHRTASGNEGGTLLLNYAWWPVALLEGILESLERILKYHLILPFVLLSLQNICISLIKLYFLIAFLPWLTENIS